MLFKRGHAYVASTVDKGGPHILRQPCGRDWPFRTSASYIAVFIARLFSLIHFSIVRRWTARFLARGPFKDDDGGSLGGSARLLDTRVLCTDILVGQI